MNCETCKQARETIPYIAHESAMSRAERTIRRLWILCIIMLAVLIGSNVAWFVFESRFEKTETTTTAIEATQEADGESSNYLVGGDYIGGETDN